MYSSVGISTRMSFFEELFTIKTWIVFLSTYFMFLLVLFCGLCIREMIEILTDDQHKKIFKKFSNGRDLTLLSQKIEPYKSPFDGLIGQHFTLTLTYTDGTKTNDATFFVKSINESNQLMFEMAKTACLYEKEELFFNVLLPAFEHRGLDVTFAPESYLCSNDTVVLKDISMDGFRGTPKTKPLDLEHSKCCLKTLAKLHVTSIIYEVIKSTELDRNYNILEDHDKLLKDVTFNENDNSVSLYYLRSMEGIIKVIDLIYEGNDKVQYIEEFQNTFNICSKSTYFSGLKCTILHGDLWSNNFLHRYNDLKVIDSKLLDYQTIKYGPPSLDVLQFIYTNTRLKFREENMNDLLNFYYEALGKVLCERALDIKDYLPRKQFDEACERCKVPAKIQALLDRSITFLSDELYAKALESDDTFRKFILEDRAVYIVDSFKTSDAYRELVVEDLADLRNLLFS